MEEHQPTQPKNMLLHVRVPKGMRAQIEAEARRLQLRPSEVIRWILAEYLARTQPVNPVDKGNSPREEGCL